MPFESFSSRPRLALFDLDHTLLPLDSDYEWGEFTIRIGWRDAQEFGRRNAAFYADYQAGHLNVADYVRFATEALRERGPHEAALAHARFMREVITPAIRPQALQLLQRHKQAGEHIIIITATNEFVTRPIAQALGVSDIVPLQLQRGPDGWFNGDILGEPTMREGKVRHMQQWLAARGWSWNDVHTTFYSDSINDLPLLEQVNEPIATNPDARLRAIAHERGWPILDLFAAAPVQTVQPVQHP